MYKRQTIPERFKNVKEEAINLLYITQLNEFIYVEEASNEHIIQIYYEDLEDFFETLSREEQ